jgi:hypothetical protein
MAGLIEQYPATVHSVSSTRANYAAANMIGDPTLRGNSLWMADTEKVF